GPRGAVAHAETKSAHSELTMRTFQEMPTKLRLARSVRPLRGALPLIGAQSRLIDHRTPRMLRPSAHETLHRGLEQLVVWAAFGSVAPYLFCILLLATGPQHLADMRRNLGIGPLGVGFLQKLQAFLGVAHPIQHPTHAVENKGVIRRKGERLLDVLLGFLVAVGAIGQRIAES